MMNAHTINAEMVEKCIASYVRGGRKVNQPMARSIGNDLIAAGHGFDSATDAAECFKSRIWNAGYVR
jgi:hypothetical protein